MLGFLALVCLAVGGYLLYATPDKPVWSFAEDGYELQRKLAVVIFLVGVVLGIGYLINAPYASEQAAIGNARAKIVRTYKVTPEQVKFDGLICIGGPYRSTCRTWKAKFKVIGDQENTTVEGLIEFNESGDPVISEERHGR